MDDYVWGGGPNLVPQPVPGLTLAVLHTLQEPVFHEWGPGLLWTLEEVEGGWQPHRNNNGINYSRPLELSETKLPTKEHTWAGTWPLAHM